MVDVMLDVFFQAEEGKRDIGRYRWLGYVFQAEDSIRASP